MKPQPCCQSAGRESFPTPRRAPRWRRGGELASWIIPSATLALLPKCPVCLAAYVALFTGAGISLAGASLLRSALLILSLSALLCLTLKRVQRYRKASRSMLTLKK